jgi:hypothetical protein
MGKVLWLARLFGKDKVVMYWSGSDVLGAQQQYAEGTKSHWVAGRIHWAGAPWLAEEVRAMGLPCEYIPITWVPIQKEIAPLPERFSVLVYMPGVRLAKLYGLERILEAARAFPEIDFRLMGLVEGQITMAPSNLEILGRIADNNMADLYRRATVYWRPVAHDGLSFMSLEALSRGRYVMWSYPFPHCAQTSNLEQDMAELRRLYTLHQAGMLPLNRPGIEIVKQRFSPQAIREEHLRRWREIIVGHQELTKELNETPVEELRS